MYQPTVAEAVASDLKTVCRSRTPLRPHGRRRQPAFATLAAAALLVGCSDSKPGPEAEIRAWVAAAEADAEARDRGGLMARVADSYADARGNDRRAVDAMLRYLLSRHSSVSLLTHIDHLQILGGSAAELGLTVGMAGNDRSNSWSAEARRLDLELEKRGGQWRVIGARWGRPGGELR